MSLCYDSEKWLMITLALVSLTLTIGLIGLAYALDEDYPPFNDDKTREFCQQMAWSNLTYSAPDCIKQ